MNSVSPPPSYESLRMAGQEPFIPPRFVAPTEGRNSIRYPNLPAAFDTTKIFLIDNRTSDIITQNYQNDHSNYLTSVVQDDESGPYDASTQFIKLDDRSRWGGEFKSILHMNMPNITEYMFSNNLRIKVPASADDKGVVQTWEWRTITLPEGNFSDTMVIDLLNNAVVDDYLVNGRQHGVREEDIGVKFDTRNMRLGYDPITGLIMPGKYTFQAFHPDIILGPGCAVDFTHSRLNNLLGIRKRFPYEVGFIISYEDLMGGNIPALLKLSSYNPFTPHANIEPQTQDPRGRSYHVGEDPEGRETDTWYRSWYLAYNYGPEDGVKKTTLLVNGDVTCGVEQMYWSLPNMMQEPITCKPGSSISNYPVVGAELLPMFPRSFFNAQALYSQLLQDKVSSTHIFNRFPENAIMQRPPAPTIQSISENRPSLTNHGIIPMRNTIPGVQRVSVTDARRRSCPYVYKSLGIITPKVLSSRTF